MLSTPEQEKQLKDLHARIDAAHKPPVTPLVLPPASDWHIERPILAKSERGAVLKVYGDEPLDFTTYDGTSQTVERKPGNGLVIAGGPNPDNETYTVTLKPGAGEWTMLGIEIVQDESLPGLRVARGADRLVLTEVDATAGNTPLHFSSGISNLKQSDKQYPPSAAFDGDPHSGWAVSAYNETTHVFLALRFTQPLRTAADTPLTVRLHHDSEIRRAVTGRFRLYLSTGQFPFPDLEKGKVIPEDISKIVEKAEDKRSKDEKAKLEEIYRWMSPEAAAEESKAEQIEGEAARLEASIPHVVVSEATTPAETRILPRGNWMDDSGDVVEPAIPVFLGKLDTGGRRATRLDLANWLVSPQNPLTARVFVNRLWREFFGTGLSKTLDDLGSQGEWPTHPEVLDWLASEFMAPQFDAGGTHAWDVKHIIRLIVLSQTYRQASLSTPELDDRDPYNRLLARQSRFRIDAENVRDVALAASGLLASHFGGPSVKPYEPDGYLAALNFPKREYAASRGDDLYRRGVYTFWQRSFLHPSLLTFDAPTREECTINRTNSNTPLQALVLLNDPIYVEAARALAEHMLERKGDRIGWAFERTVSREPTAAEHQILNDLLRQSTAEFRRSPESAAKLVHIGESPLPANEKPIDLAAMTAVARAILNMHETITRN